MSLTKVFQFDAPGACLSAPVVVAQSLLVATQVGTFLRVDLTATAAGASAVGEAGGQVTSAALDRASGELFVVDCNRPEVLKLESGGSGFNPVANYLEGFEGKPFRGPHSIVVEPSTGELVFTDSGAFGDTGLSNRRGAVYRTVNGRRQVVAVVPPSLAYPAGVAVAPDGSIFVCELCANRVLRLAPRPAGVFHASVFLQLSGYFGPMFIAINPSNSDVYVSRFDIKPPVEGKQPTCHVSVFGPNGDEKGTVTVPGAAIDGLCCDDAGSRLFIVQSNTVYSLQL